MPNSFACWRGDKTQDFDFFFFQNERLQALLADNEKMNLADMELIPLPLEPQVKIKGIIPEKATLFKVNNV